MGTCLNFFFLFSEQPWSDGNTDGIISWTKRETCSSEDGGNQVLKNEFTMEEGQDIKFHFFQCE